MNRFEKAAATGLIAVLAAAAAIDSVLAQEPGGPHLDLPEVLEAGESGPQLLLLHCAGCGASSWQRFMDVNQNRFRMVAPTLPGYAGSPRPDLPLWSDRTVFQDNALAQLSALLDERGLTDVVVVGQSFGSTIALQLATARPDVISGVVAVDATPTNPLALADESLAERMARAKEQVDDDWAIRLRAPAAWRSFNAARTQPDEEQRVLHHGMFMSSDRVSMLHYWRENLLRDLNPQFRNLRAPYLDIKAIRPGDANPDSTIRVHEEAIREVGRPPLFRQVYFHDTSHWAHLDRPRALGLILEDFATGAAVTHLGPFQMGQVKKAGSGQRDVILMPCLGCDRRSWDPFMTRNAEQYRMWAVTWPGLGDTPLPPVLEDPHGTPYFDYLIDALKALIRREGMVNPVIVGHSAAAVLAVRFAAEYPDLVGGVVNVDAVVANQDTFGFTPEERRRWADQEMSDVLSKYDDDDAWRELNAAPSLPDAERATMYSEMWLTPPRANVFAYWLDWLRTDSGVLLPELQVPFLGVHALSLDGQRANEQRQDAVARYKRAVMPPGSRIVFIRDSGHTIWEYQPEALDEVLREFILGDAFSGGGS